MFVDVTLFRLLLSVILGKTKQKHSVSAYFSLCTTVSFLPPSLQLVMADTRQNKIFVTRDEGVTFEGRELDFKPNNIRYQGRTVPNSDKGTLSQHIMGYETDTQSVREHCLSMNIASLLASWVIASRLTSHKYKHVFHCLSIV